MKNKYVLPLVVIIVIVIGVGLFMKNNHKTELNSVRPAKTTSTDPDEYKKCVAEGGKVTAGGASNDMCLLNGNTYYNGNI